MCADQLYKRSQLIGEISMKRNVFAIVGLFFLFQSFSQAAIPSCLDQAGKPLQNSNTAVLNWLHTTPKNFTARALVTGILVKRYADQTGHAHFAIDMNGDNVGDLEVIYQYDAGAMNDIKVGMQVAACGDYITDPKGSPNGGIIHWVHCRNRPGNHYDGYVTLDGKLFGFDPQDGSACANPASLRFQSN
jgi:hypothetical protein